MTNIKNADRHHCLWRSLNSIFAPTSIRNRSVKREDRDGCLKDSKLSDLTQDKNC